jgi:predicted RNA-binding Zn-ribbon protein involved in translation (DUF1610 family)
VVFKRLKETVAAAHRRGVGIKICPVCGSTDISAITMTGYITQPAYTCNKCGFQNTIFPEADAAETDQAAPTEEAAPEEGQADTEEDKEGS